MIPAQLDVLRDPAQLEALVQAFGAAIATGLARDGQQIKALRTFLRPPSAPVPSPEPVAVIDVGGTNCRAALLVSEAGSFRLVAGPVSRALPVRSGTPLAAEAFFDVQADLLAELTQQPGLRLGYCFSYPAQVQPDLDAQLLRWTKGIAVPGVVGQPVGALLREALCRRDLAPAGVVVLNDTVACLLGAAVAAKGPSQQAIGLIAGTGTNMAGFFDAAHAPKLAGSGPMALNLESGNFGPPRGLLTAADGRVDADNDPGAQRWEKASSGHYLPYVLVELLNESAATEAAAIDPVAGCAPLVRLMDDPEAPELTRELIRALFQRSADMIAAGLAALLGHYAAGRVTIVAEGSLFWRTPGYAARVGETLSGLVGAERFELVRLEHVNLIGAACAALQAHQ